ncbi:hypothetical protein M2408_001375 [Sphingobacterium sp. BIGb0165]|nr:hypothetical protein [Sphingobacterium sp. BIGb0165]
MPFFTRKPLLETVKGFLRLHTSQKIPKKHGFQRKMTPFLYFQKNDDSDAKAPGIRFRNGAIKYGSAGY